MLKALAGLTLVLLTGCNGLRQDQVQPFTNDLNMACNTAMGLAPFAPPIAPWILAGCGTAEGIAKLASDPTSIAWVNDLIAKAKLPPA